MKNDFKSPLVVSEIAGIWQSYMTETMSVCVLKHFLNNVEDKETHNLLQEYLNLSKQHIKKLEKFFNNENLAVPQGFTESDVDINAPRLYTDSFYLFYLHIMSNFGMDAYSLIIRYSPRTDIRKYFSECLTEALDLTIKTMDLLLLKGLFVKPPRLEVSKDVTFIKKQNFLSGMFGQTRPLLAREVTNVFSGILIDIISRALLGGFGQVARSKEVRNFLFKGRDSITNHLEQFSSILTKEDMPIPSISDSFVTESIISPFSDRLMMFHVLSLCAFGINVDGAAIASSLRSDLAAIHTRFSGEIAKYGLDGTIIMINNGWMEQPPQAIRHKELAGI